MQTIVTLIVVATAVAWLARRLFSQGESKCGGCTQCGTSQKSGCQHCKKNNAQ